jgi:hypothetical protein
MREGLRERESAARTQLYGKREMHRTLSAARADPFHLRYNGEHEALSPSD